MASSPASRYAVWTCYAAMMSLALVINLPPIYLTTFSEEFGGAGGLSPEQMGYIPAALFAGVVVGIVVTGPLADRFGGKLFAVAGLALTIIGLASMALSKSYAVLLAASFGTGLGGGFIDMILSPIVSALEPERRAVSMNWLHSFYSFGAVGMALIGSCGLALHVPWRTVFFAILPFPFVVLVAFLAMRVPSLVSETREPVKKLAGSGFFVAGVVAIFFAGAAEMGMAVWLSTFAQRVMDFSKSAGALAAAAFLAAMWVGRVSAAVLSHRLNPLRLMTGACVLAFVLYLAGSLCQYPPAAIAACVGVGLAIGCLWPTTLATVANRIPHGGATMFGFLAASGTTGCIVMPWVVGVLTEHSTFRWGLASAALAPAAMIAVLMWMNKRTDN